MKVSQVMFVLVGLVSFISPAIGAPVGKDGIKTETVIARDDDSRDITPEEQAQIGQVLQSLGCSSWEDVDFEIDDQLYEVDGAKCKDGQEYDIYLDTNYQVKFKRKDND